MQIGDETASVQPGRVILIPSGAIWHIENNSIEDLVFFCIVSPQGKTNDETLV